MNTLYTITYTPANPLSAPWKDEIIEAEGVDLAIYASTSFRNTGDYDRIKAVPVDTSTMSRVDITVLRIPKAFRDMVRSAAYDRGHHAGEDEVGAIAEGMVADLVPCIANYDRRG
jgi:hypothetical protein